MKLIIEEANINMEIDKDQLYTIFKDDEENNIKISEDLAKEFHDGYTFQIDKIEGVEEPKDLSSLSFKDLIRYLEEASMANLDKIVADYIEKANSYYLQNTKSINDLNSVDDEDKSSQVSELSEEINTSNKDLTAILTDVMNLHEGSSHSQNEDTAILKVGNNSYRKVDINDLKEIAVNVEYSKDEFEAIRSVLGEKNIDLTTPSKWLLVIGEDNKLKPCEIDPIELPKDNENVNVLDFVVNKIKEHYGETTDNKTQDKEEESADNDLYNGFLLLTLLVLCFVIVSHWTTISQFIAPALSWITNICFPALVAFFSTNVGIGVAVTLGVLALAGVVTAIVLSNGSNDPIKEINDGAKPTGSSDLNAGTSTRLPKDDAIGLKAPRQDKREDNSGVLSHS